MSNGNNAAFPLNWGSREFSAGITKREFFAALALAGLCATQGLQEGFLTDSELGNQALRAADALLAAFEEQPLSSDPTEDTDGQLEAAKPDGPGRELEFVEKTSLVCPSCGYRKIQTWKNPDGFFFCRCANCDAFGSDSDDESGARVNFRHGHARSPKNEPEMQPPDETEQERAPRADDKADEKILTEPLDGCHCCNHTFEERRAYRLGYYAGSMGQEPDTCPQIDHAPFANPWMEGHAKGYMMWQQLNPNPDEQEGE